MSYEDVKVFMNLIIEFEFDEVNIVGFVIYCVGLDLVYDLVRCSYFGIDFWFIFKFEELIFVFFIVRDLYFVFNEFLIYESLFNKLIEMFLEMFVKGVLVYLV